MSSRRAAHACLHGAQLTVTFGLAGVILLSEETHRLAYNAAFKHYDVKPKGQGPVAEWSVAYYDKLQNSVGGGKAKMHFFFGEQGRCSRLCCSAELCLCSGRCGVPAAVHRLLGTCSRFGLASAEQPARHATARQPVPPCCLPATAVQPSTCESSAAALA